MEEGSNKFNQNLEVFEILRFVDKKKRLHQKLMLDGIEEILGNTDEYKAIRKIILDNTSELSRSFVRAVFGDTFEGKIQR